MNLHQAPFQKNLRVLKLDLPTTNARMVLEQLGLYPGEEIEKIHEAPFGDPVAIRIGNHVFSLRKEVCMCISVEAQK